MQDLVPRSKTERRTPIPPALRLALLPSDRSSFIDFARIAAALMVALAHLRYSFLPEYRAVATHPLWFKVLAFCSGFANDAVIVFFVISGWLVGGSLLDSRKRPHAYSDYALARFCRLASVLVPVFLLHFVLHLAINKDASPPFDILTLIGNLGGLQTVYVDCFGGNFPLWSLANEVAYYAGFALLIAVLDARFSGTARVGLMLILSLYILALTPQIWLYSTLWLVGVFSSRVTVTPRPTVAVGFLALFLVWISYKRFLDLPHTYGFDAMSAALFAASLVFMNDAGREGRTTIWTFGAAISFSLYVVHIPVLQLLRVSDFKNSTAVTTHELVGFLFYTAIMLCSAIAFSLIFEQRYGSLRRIMKRTLLPVRERVPVIAGS